VLTTERSLQYIIFHATKINNNSLVNFGHRNNLLNKIILFLLEFADEFHHQPKTKEGQDEEQEQEAAVRSRDDVDEIAYRSERRGGCATDNGGCEQICISGYDGHFYCRCSTGYALAYDGRGCQGITNYQTIIYSSD